MTDGVYDRFDPSKNYDKHLFRAGNVLQSAELNEVQTSSQARLQGIADAIFKDGDIVRDARITVNESTGVVSCQSGAVYIRGAVRGVPPGTLTIPITGTVAVGVYLIESTVTEVDDPDLGDPATELRTYGQPGAARLKIDPVWGFAGDDTDGDFFPIYSVVDGQLAAKEAPPAFDSMTQAIAKYDRDSSGSNYVVSGLRVTKLDDLMSGEQVYNLSDGRARVNGFGVDLSTSRRVIYAATPDLRSIDSEPTTATTGTAQRINVARPPIKQIQSVHITAEKTVTLTHGAFTGAQDPLPDTSIVSIVAVNQGGTWSGSSFTGGTTYAATTDYLLTSGKVDWTPAGAEPATNSTYQVRYRYITTATANSPDLTGFSVSGAVVGSTIFVNYTTMLPRIDRLCLDDSGNIIWVKGVATDYNPVRPTVPSNLCELAQVVQTWDANRYIVNDGVRTVPMSDIEAMQSRMDVIIDLIAQQKLVSDLSVRDASAKKGVFVDPFLDDAQRDAGITQTAAVFDGILTLPIADTVLNPSADITDPVTCASTLSIALRQTARTGAMNVNPYMAFAVLPAQVTLSPSVDRWTQIVTTWASPVTRQFISGQGSTVASQSTSTSSQLIKTTTDQLEKLRQIDLAFTIKGFVPGEVLTNVKFDGLDVTASLHT